jgi:glycoprotein-N-acetylgalactosamine 3-beta-galactosyltransferase
MLWRKSRLAWIRSYEEHIDDFDWFIRGDDDTYLMMDNVREHLDSLDPNENHYLGRHFYISANHSEAQFYSGGPGTILSQGALRELISGYKRNAKVFNNIDTFADDLELGMSMQKVGIPTTFSLDDTGGQLFIALGLDSERTMNRADTPGNWYWIYSPEAKVRTVYLGVTFHS